MRESIKNSIMGTISDLQRIGLVDEITMKNIESRFRPSPSDAGPEPSVQIPRETIRDRLHNAVVA